MNQEKLAIFELGVTAPLPTSENRYFGDYRQDSGPFRNRFHLVPGFSFPTGWPDPRKPVRELN